MYKIAVLISGGGTNLQSVIDNVESKYLNCKIECVISDSKDAFGIERAILILMFLIKKKLKVNFQIKF